MNCGGLHRLFFPHRLQLRNKEQQVLKEWVKLAFHYKLRPTDISNMNIIPVHMKYHFTVFHYCFSIIIKNLHRMSIRTADKVCMISGNIIGPLNQLCTGTTPLTLRTHLSVRRGAVGDCEIREPIAFLWQFSCIRHWNCLKLDHQFCHT